MFQKVIYKRQYNKPTIEEIEAEIADEPIPAEVKEPAPSKDNCSSKDIFKQLNEGAVYVPLPERKPIAKVFISQAIEISENYQIDTKIRQGAGTVTVIFSFDCGGAMGFLKSVIQYADDISFFSSTNGYEIVLALDFTLTHYTGTEGRCVPDYFGLCIAQAFYYCAAIQELEIYFEFSDG